ncbi:hypothetical protein KR044_001744 [Drosophila immigrans]|nr:hypothetical protein KR044_001744 [Drosophila immigrans]
MRRLLISLPARLLLHVVASGHLGYTVYYDYRYVQLPELATELRMVPPLGGKFKYLTFLNGLLQTVYYLLATTHDLYPWPGLRQLRDFLLASFVVPLALTVSVTFWLLRGINGEYIHPPLLDEIYPTWLTHTMHSLIVVYAVLELCLAPHRYPRRRRGFTALGIILASYLAWLYLVKIWTGIWVYPFLGGFFAPLRWCFFAVIVSLAFCYYVLGEQLNYALWAQ